MINRLFWGINVLMAFLLFMACLISFMSFKFVSAIAVLSLIVPFLFLINIVFLIFWLFRKQKKRALLSLFVLIVGYLIFGTFYGIGKAENGVEKDGVSIMTYNVWGFNKNEWIKEPNIGDKIISLIKENTPDILSIQEHSRIRHRQLKEYPYRAETPYSQLRTVQAIFSKYPIVDKGSLDLPGTVNNIIYADILIKLDTVRVYNVHLQSFSIVPSSETFSSGEQSERNYKRLVSTFLKQVEQAKIFDAHLKKSPYRNIVCGDFNNTQFSNVYRIVKGSLTDTFLEKGTGLGRTYSLLGFPIRIDYILADEDFEVLAHKNFDQKLSDHYPVMATLKL